MRDDQFDSIRHGVAPAARYDIYRNIHKALRTFMCDTLLKVGRCDCKDRDELAGTLSQLRALIGFCHGHLQHENDFVHAAMEARLPGSAAGAAEEHVHHCRELERLATLADAVEAAPAEQRSGEIACLYDALALFVGENLVHMRMEESRHNALLWSTHSDGELLAIERAIHASLAPDEAMQGMGWMLQAMNPGEHAAMLAGIDTQAPAFGAIMELARSRLDARQFDKLERALGMHGRPALHAYGGLPA